MQQVAGGRIAYGVVDYYPAPPSPVVVELPVTEVKRLLGIELSVEEIQGILEALEFQMRGCRGSREQGAGEQGSRLSHPLIRRSLIR